MTKKEFVKRLSDKLNISQKESSNVLDTVLGGIEEALKSGDRQLTFVGWGSFKVVTRDAREGRNPQNGKTISIPAKKVIRFKAGSSLEEKVNSSKDQKVNLAKEQKATSTKDHKDHKDNKDHKVNSSKK